jgi:hypothetical protein
MGLTSVMTQMRRGRTPIIHTKSVNNTSKTTPGNRPEICVSPPRITAE